MIASLKWILLYTAFKGKIDPRDWMNADVISLTGSQAESERSGERTEGPQEANAEAYLFQPIANYRTLTFDKALSARMV